MVLRGAALSLVLMLVACGGAAAEPWPRSAIDFTVGGGEGSGADIMARAIAEGIRSEGLSEVPFQVFNRPGGALCIAMTHLSENSGRSSVIMGWTTTVLTTEIRGNCDVGYDDVTPIALLGEDPYLLMASSQGPHQTFNDLVQNASSATEPINVGGGSEGGPDHIALIILSKAAGIEANFVPFESGAEAVTALLGGNLDAVIGNPGEFVGQIEAGTINALLSLTEEPLADLGEIPTARDLGYDAVYAVWRGVGAPANLTPDDKAGMIELFRKFSQTDDWHTFTSQNFVLERFLPGDDFVTFLAASKELHTQVLTDLGLIGQ